jgi:hypothetical protein
MAAIARPGFCENRNRPMSKKLSTPAASVVSGKVPAPVRVRLKRVNCDQAIPYPPDGQTREWWHRLKNAFGTASSAFVGASLQQLIAAARLPNSGICEIAVNASLAFIEGAKPLTSVLTGAGGAGRAPPCTTPYIEPAWFGAGYSVSPVFGKHRRNSSTTVQFGPCPSKS